MPACMQHPRAPLQRALLGAQAPANSKPAALLHRLLSARSTHNSHSHVFQRYITASFPMQKAEVMEHSALQQITKTCLKSQKLAKSALFLLHGKCQPCAQTVA